MEKENSEKLKRKVKKVNIIDKISTDSGATRPEAVPRVQMLKSGMKNLASSGTPFQRSSRPV